MSNVIIEVCVYDEFRRNEPVRVALNLPRNSPALSAIDLPAPGTDRMTALVFCTPPDIVNELMKHREMVSKEIAAGVIRVLAQRDTENGYNKDSP